MYKDTQNRTPTITNKYTKKFVEKSEYYYPMYNERK